MATYSVEKLSGSTADNMAAKGRASKNLTRRYARDYTREREVVS